MERRKALVSISSSLVAGLAGCSGFNLRQADPWGKKERNSTTDLPFNTPTPDQCTAARHSGAHLPQPTPVQGIEPQSYPGYPTSLNKSSVREFVEGFESAYVHNLTLSEDPTTKAEDINVKISVAQGPSRLSGKDYLTGVNGTIILEGLDTSSATADGTPSVLHDDRFASWYYLTDSSAIRQRDSDTRISKDSEPELDAARIIFCD